MKGIHGGGEGLFCISFIQRKTKQVLSDKCMHVKCKLPILWLPMATSETSISYFTSYPTDLPAQKLELSLFSTWCLKTLSTGSAKQNTIHWKIISEQWEVGQHRNEHCFISEGNSHTEKHFKIFGRF